MDNITVMRIVVTLASFVCFICILIWAYKRSNQARFDEAAQLPFAED